MIVDQIKEVLLWCFIINTGMLLWWFLFIVLARNWVYRMHTKWFKISEERFDEIHYAGMAFFKICIFVLYLVPYIALCIVF